MFSRYKSNAGRYFSALTKIADEFNLVWPISSIDCTFKIGQSLLGLIPKF